MILQVNDEYRIVADDHQWIVQQMPKKTEKRTKEAAWRSIAYIGSLDAAVLWLAERRIRMIEGTWPAIDALPTLCAALDEIKRECLAVRDGDNKAVEAAL